jgi:hypothetical protein
VAQADVSIQITTAQRTPISRFIYGMNLTTDIAAHPTPVDSPGTARARRPV